MAARPRTKLHLL